MPRQTPSQTIGPFFSFSLVAGGENVLIDERSSGERILVEGRVLDGAGEPIADALVEIWQADSNGIFKHLADPRHEDADPFFAGFGRSATDEDGRYCFRTIKPGPVPTEDGQQQAPHINVTVFARGMPIQAITRIYFADETANERDPVLASIADPQRQQTLSARREQSADGIARYCLDIVLQGEHETVFFDA